MAAISHGAEWTFELIERYDEAIREIAVGEFGLDCYANQIEVIASEQMLDACHALMDYGASRYHHPRPRELSRPAASPTAPGTAGPATWRAPR